MKFKAFDKENNQLIDWLMLSQSAWKYLLYTVLVSNKENFLILPYIGVQDINGEDIYLFDMVEDTYTNEVLTVGNSTRQTSHILISGNLEFSNTIFKKDFHARYKRIGNFYDNKK